MILKLYVALACLAAFTPFHARAANICKTVQATLAANAKFLSYLGAEQPMRQILTSSDQYQQVQFFDLIDRYKDLNENRTSVNHAKSEDGKLLVGDKPSKMEQEQKRSIVPPPTTSITAGNVSPEKSLADRQMENWASYMFLTIHHAIAQVSEHDDSSHGLVSLYVTKEGNITDVKITRSTGSAFTDGKISAAIMLIVKVSSAPDGRPHPITIPVQAK